MVSPDYRRFVEIAYSVFDDHRPSSISRLQRLIVIMLPGLLILVQE